MAETDSTSEPDPGNDDTFAVLGFSAAATRRRLVAAARQEPRDSLRRRTAFQVARWLVATETTHLPNRLAEAKFLVTLKAVERRLRPLVIAAGARLADARRHEARVFGDSAPHSRAALLESAARQALSLLETLETLRTSPVEQDEQDRERDSLPPADPKAGGQAPMFLLGDIELALSEGGFSLDEVDALVTRHIAGNRNPTEQTREASRTAMRKRIRRAEARRTRGNAEEAAALDAFLNAHPDNRRRLDRLLAEEPAELEDSSRDTTLI